MKELNDKDEFQTMTKLFKLIRVSHQNPIREILLLVTAILVLGFTGGAKPSVGEFAGKIAEMETSNMKEILESWVDPKLIESLKNTALTRESAQKLYYEYLGMVVELPDADKYTLYGIKVRPEAIVNVEALGKRIHNMLYALPDDELEKWGPFLGKMRDVLLIDFIHIRYALKNDNARDLYWYNLHHSKYAQAVIEYVRIRFFQDGFLQQESTYEDYTVRVYRDPEAFEGAFSVFNDGNLVYAKPGVFRIGLILEYMLQSELVAMGKDITGDGIGNLLISEWSGGAHCCYEYFIYSLAVLSHITLFS